MAEAKTKDFELLKNQVAMEKQGAQLSTIKSVNKNLYQKLSRTEIEVALQNEALKTEKATASMVEAKNKALKKERIYSWCIAGLIIIFIVIVAGLKYYDYKKIKNELLREQNIAINEQKTQLKTSNDVKDKIFSIISHDLKGPIGSMQSFYEMLDIFEMQPDLRDMLDTMALENKTIFNILDNLLNWAKTQMSELTPVFKKVNISAIVNENMQLLHTIAETKKIQIINEVSEELLAESDLDMTRIVIRNLMQNAIKFTKPGGIVKVGGTIKDDWTEISVADTGVGMSAKKLSSLFSLKSNQSTYGTANEKGTGLGLVLCYDFIKICKGEIEVASEIGKGTTITIKLNKA